MPVAELARCDLGHDGEARGADERRAGRKRQRARRGDADARAGERAGPDGDGDAIEVVEAETGLLHRLVDHRHEPLGVAGLEALERARKLDDASARASPHLRDAHGAGVKAGIEGENVHGPQAYTQSTADFTT